MYRENYLRKTCDHNFLSNEVNSSEVQGRLVNFLENEFNRNTATLDQKGQIIYTIKGNFPDLQNSNDKKLDDKSKMQADMY